MQRGVKTYEQLRAEFTWDLPDQCNMASDVCDKWAEAEPDRTAIIDLSGNERKDVTFFELQTLANKLANLLVVKGVKSGDRIGVLRTQSVWTAAAHIAVWKTGAISIPLFILFGEEALHTRLDDSGTKFVITDVENAKKHKALFDELPDLSGVLIPESDVDDAISDQFETVAAGPDQPGLIIYTSGTTGPPKGALHGHRVLRGHLPGVEISHDLLPQQGDCLWTPADWAWIGGLLDVLMPGLFHGVPVVAARMEKFNSQECVRIIDQAGVKNIFFPPTALRLLKAEGFGCAGLRTVACGGEPLGEEMLQWGREALGVTINEFYGQTECNMVVSSCAQMFEPKPGCIGQVVPGHQVEVIDDAGEPTLDEGDIAVLRGTPVMMLEYWNKPDATKEKFRGDWLLTGDRGLREGDFIRFVGRDDDVITSAGYRIGPAEIEDCLLKHDAVLTVGVIGKPDPQRTEIVKAYVVLKDGFEVGEALAADLQSHVKSRLAAYEYPREIEFVTELPMTVTGKIKRKELKARAILEMEQQ